ncbi:transposase [Streptomyces sp. NPDC021356]|uniref:transposase n=1 Tax=Streptomyces sp. NPDC021356 TaxID=3154900 RepID=UPI0033E8040B
MGACRSVVAGVQVPSAGRRTAPVDVRAAFAAGVYVLTSGCAWRHLPGEFGVSPATAHRRFTAWLRTPAVPRGLRILGVGRTLPGLRR